MFSNDIQYYSKTLAGVYLTTWRKESTFDSGEEIVKEAAAIVAKVVGHLPKGLDYSSADTLEKFNAIEVRNRKLLQADFKHKWHLFLKNYSGTWWSAEQCMWIDALRQVAETRRRQPHFNLVMASLLHAMAYSSQGTGHYAQYRDAKNEASMRDIGIYRRRNLTNYFVKKYNAIAASLPTTPPKHKHEITSLDYVDRLKSLPRCTVYADPPYAFVHYSRFYHAAETLVLYDFPELQVKCGSIVKGRYREDRHQSPFCIASLVPGAFVKLFEGVAETSSNLVLSYSNTGMISLDDLLESGSRTLGRSYEISTVFLDHQHMTMGRREDRHREVQECLLLARYKR